MEFNWTEEKDLSQNIQSGTRVQMLQLVSSSKLKNRMVF